jgi:hypothetical protein
LKANAGKSMDASMHIIVYNAPFRLKQVFDHIAENGIALFLSDKSELHSVDARTKPKNSLLFMCMMVFPARTEFRKYKCGIALGRRSFE